MTLLPCKGQGDRYRAIPPSSLHCASLAWNLTSLSSQHSPIARHTSLQMAPPQSDSFGLLELYCPSSPLVDVCFIHGLRGGNVSTWSSHSLCWPRDLLCRDIPDARILSFGYDAKVIQVGSKVSQNTMAQHAMNLLAALVGDRAKTNAVKYPSLQVENL